MMILKILVTCKLCSVDAHYDLTFLCFLMHTHSATCFWAYFRRDTKWPIVTNELELLHCRFQYHTIHLHTNSTIA